MNKLYITLLFTFLFSCFAMSAENEIVSFGYKDFLDGVNLSVYNPITKDKDGYWAWVEYEYTTPLTQKEDVLTQQIIYRKMELLVYSLNWRKFAIASFTLYDKEGCVISTYDCDVLDFRYIVPRSRGEEEMKFIKDIYNTPPNKGNIERK